jgi:DNA-binding MarR family transcriptional regulator
MNVHDPNLDRVEYMHIMLPKTQADNGLFDLPCACQNLRRLARVVSRMYDEELRRAGVEITQFGLLTALGRTGEANQKRLSAGLAIDSTTLTRTLSLLRKKGWIRVSRGEDRRERLFSLTPAGEKQMAAAQPFWERAETRLRRELGDRGFKSLAETLLQMTNAALRA